MVKKEGPYALTKGWFPGVLGILPYASIDLALFELLRDQYVNRYAQPPSSTELLSCATFSVLSAQIVAYPLYFARTKLQIQNKLDKTRFTGFTDVMYRTV
jgi:solute carrier family 25 (mitochondrial phosphate transporter), member 23/24/25/41